MHSHSLINNTEARWLYFIKQGETGNNVHSEISPWLKETKEYLPRNAVQQDTPFNHNV